MIVPLAPPLAAFHRIFHPSDLSSASEVAFRHALRIALLARAEFTMLHVAAGDGAQWVDFPGVRHWLERWRLIPAGSGREAVKALGVPIHKVIAHSNDSLRACLHYLDKHPAELIVLSARQRETRFPWPGAEATPRGPAPMTLFFPEADAGFVEEHDGAVQLRRILVAVATPSDAPRAVNAAARFARSLELHSVDFTLVHIGDTATLPAVRTPTVSGWTWRSDMRTGSVTEGLLSAIQEHHAELMVMGTDGHHGFLDALRGNITERILHDGHCPLLAVPGESAP